MPGGLNPFAALTVTYLVGAAVSAVLFFVLGKQPNPIKELSNLNWAPFVLGFVIVGLEVGYIYAYKAGWQVSTAQIVQAALVAIVLVFVGYGLYHETLTLKKIAGIVICLGGLVLINI